MYTLFQDLSLAARRLTRTPGFTAVVLLTLGLCVGANAAIFSVINAVMVRPLPFPEPDRVVRVRPEQTVTARMIDGIAAATESYTALAGASPAALTLTGTDQPELVPASVVGVDHLAVFAVQPMMGRGFLDEDSRPGAEPVVLLGYGLWQRRFGGDPSVVGRRVTLGGEGTPTRTVIGVMPVGYRPFQWESEAFVPMVVAPATHDYSDMARFVLFARLRDGQTTAAASAELKTVLQRLATSTERGYVSEEEARDATVIREHVWRVAGFERSLWLLLGSVGAVLLIGCVNVANLLLARAVARERELAVRRALGAAPGRILRLLLTESALLGIAGGALGLLAATVGLSALQHVVPANLPTVSAISVDLTVFAFALVVSLIGAMLFGLLPALRSSRVAEAAIRQTSRSTIGEGKLRLNRSLVAAEMAICVALVAAAGLFVKSLTVLRDVDPGFAPAGLATMRVTFSPARYPNESTRRNALAEIERRIEALPGVDRVGSIHVLPMTQGTMGVGISPDGNPIAEDERPLLVSYRIVTPGYAEAVGIPLLEGRHLEPTDRDEAAPAGLVNQAMANTMWPGALSVVGREVRWDNGELWFTVVGVVDDVHQHSLSQTARAEAYVPYEQDGWATSMHLMIRGGGLGLLSAGRDAVWAVDPNIPVSGLRSMTDVVDVSLATPRFNATLFGLFAMLATVLAAVGIYGVTSHMVSLRTREIGIRLAFGATNRDVMWWLGRLGVTPVAIGLLVGLAIALSGTRLIAGMLYGIRPTDPMVFAAVVMALVVVALAALVLPAKRALRVDPISSLRSE
jgi:predicted permease